MNEDIEISEENFTAEEMAEIEEILESLPEMPESDE